MSDKKKTSTKRTTTPSSSSSSSQSSAKKRHVSSSSSSNSNDKHNNNKKKNGEKRPSSSAAAAATTAAAPRILDRADRKELRKKRRQARPHHEVVSDLNKMFQISMSNLSKAERTGKIDEILNACAGKIGYVVTKHDAARVFQNIIKYGRPEQRQQVLDEICTATKLATTASTEDTSAPAVQQGLLGVALDPYGFRVVLKLLEHTNHATLQRVLQQLLLHVRKLSLHTNGSRVLDYLYANGKDEDRSRIRQQLYGVEFSLFDDTPMDVDSDDDDNDNDDDDEKKTTKSKKNVVTVASIVAKQPIKLPSLMNSIRSTLERAVNKELMNRRYLHTLLREYLEHVPVAGERDAMITLVGDLGAVLTSSRDGAVALSHCFAYGTPKQRKQLLKSVKDSVVEMCRSAHGYLPIIRALDVVDDTVQLNKVIGAEIREELKKSIVVAPTAAEQAAAKVLEGTGLKVQRKNHHGDGSSLLQHSTGGKVILYLLAPRSVQYFGAEERNEVLAEAVTHDGESTSRKPADKRRDELLSKLLKPLANACIRELPVLVRSSAGWRVLYEVMKEVHVHSSGGGGGGGEYGELDTKLTNGLVKEYANDLGLVETPIGQYLLKFLLVNMQPNAHTLAQELWSRAFMSNCGKMLTTNRGAFALSFILQHIGERSGMMKVLKESLKKKVDSAGGGGGGNNKKKGKGGDVSGGMKALLKAMDE